MTGVRSPEMIAPWAATLEGRRYVVWVTSEGLDWRPVHWWSPTDWRLRLEAWRWRRRNPL